MKKKTGKKQASGFRIVELTPDTLAEYGVCGYKDAAKHRELRRKRDWYRTVYPMGLRIKVLYSDSAGTQGQIEYVPGEYAHRPVDARGYLFIHCLFVGFRKEFKGRGLATSLIRDCIEEAKKQNLSGVAVVTRQGSFMAKKDIFLKNGFSQADSAEPDFQLLVYPIDRRAKPPAFRVPKPDAREPGLVIYRSAQCPYSVKNVESILETARKMKIKARLIDQDSARDARNTPCAFGTFCLVYGGRVISHHPVSNTRFVNIMKSVR